MQGDTSPSLVNQVRRIVISVFDVTETQAELHAQSLVALAEGWGGANVRDLDWTAIIKNRLGKELAWRNEQDRMSFDEVRRLTVESYEALLPKRPLRY